MAVKGTAQVDIVDVTDAYGVTLTSEAYVFPGTTAAAKAGSTTTQVIAMIGSDTATATVDASAITKPTGITVSVAANSGSPIITIAASTSFTAAGVVEIPVVIGDVTIVKKFSASIAFTGSTGAAGADALTLAITSSAGFIFKNTSIATTLTAHVYKGGIELTSSTSPTLASFGTIKWYKDGSTTAAATGATLTISSGDVTNKASYVAKLEG